MAIASTSPTPAWSLDLPLPAPSRLAPATLPAPTPTIPVDTLSLAPRIASTPAVPVVPGTTPGQLVEMTTANFNALVLQSSRPVVVEFYTPSCAASQQLGPAMGALANQRPDLVVARVNGIQQGAIAKQFGVTSVPTMLVFKNGQLVGKGVPGAPTLPALDAWLAQGKV